jgi:hypothetical protein
MADKTRRGRQVGTARWVRRAGKESRHADNQSTQGGREEKIGRQAKQRKARHECKARDKSRQVVKEG